MKKKSESLVVPASECEDFLLVPARLLTSLREEIDDLLARIGLPVRAWESPRSVAAVDPHAADPGTPSTRV